LQVELDRSIIRVSEKLPGVCLSHRARAEMAVLMTNRCRPCQIFQLARPNVVDLQTTLIARWMPGSSVRSPLILGAGVCVFIPKLRTLLLRRRRDGMSEGSAVVETRNLI
jgi:hypothetical protein